MKFKLPPMTLEESDEYTLKLLRKETKEDRRLIDMVIERGRKHGKK